jgi:hypothetical protein
MYQVQVWLRQSDACGQTAIFGYCRRVGLRRWRTLLNLAMITGLLIAVAAPGVAQLTDPLASTVDPADRAVMAEAASAVSGRRPNLARLDAVLAKLPRPTPLRGMVQTVRAGVLRMAQNVRGAQAAAEEALRLLPDDPRPKLEAMTIYTFAGSPQRAADLWMQASRESPDLARMSDRYVMMALVGRLNDLGDRARADRISARLGEIGFSAGLAPERSAAALARTREAVRAKQTGDAVQSVTAIADPDDLLSLYVDLRYAALWPRIAEWAGSDLADQSRRYLEELRGDWVAADDFQTATPYARRLASLKAYAAVLGLFLPMFDRVEPGVRLEGIEFLAPIVARALAHSERAAEARTLLAMAAITMGANDPNTLNIDGAYLTLAAREADWPEVIARANAFLARAQTFGSAINRSATVEVRAWKACALSRSGGGADADRIAAEVLLGEATLPGPAMTLHLCRGDAASAQTLLIDRLADETTRSWALAFVQPAASDLSSPLARIMDPVAQIVRGAPAVTRAAARVGRLLPEPVNTAIPTGFDPFRAQPAPRPLGPGAI